MPNTQNKNHNRKTQPEKKEDKQARFEEELRAPPREKRAKRIPAEDLEQQAKKREKELDHSILSIGNDQNSHVVARHLKRLWQTFRRLWRRKTTGQPMGWKPLRRRLQSGLSLVSGSSRNLFGRP